MRLIDADKVINNMMRLKHEKEYSDVDEAYDYGIDDCIDEVGAEPVDAKPVIHAHWELDPNGMDFGLPAWRCSNCGGKNTMIPSFISTNHGGYVPKNPNAFAGSNYCPNCGAKMDS